MITVVIAVVNSCGNELAEGKVFSWGVGAGIGLDSIPFISSPASTGGPAASVAWDSTIPAIAKASDEETDASVIFKTANRRRQRESRSHIFHAGITRGRKNGIGGWSCIDAAFSIQVTFEEGRVMSISHDFLPDEWERPFVSGGDQSILSLNYIRVEAGYFFIETIVAKSHRRLVATMKLQSDNASNAELQEPLDAFHLSNFSG